MIDEGNGWYAYTFEGADCANVIFSNNGANQTADLSRCSEGWFENGQWTNAVARKNTVLSVNRNVLQAISAYPNPAVREATFSFYLDQTYTTSLKVYDLLGNQVASIADEDKSLGWYNLSLDTSQLPEGLYVYRFSLNGHTISKKLMIRK